MKKPQAAFTIVELLIVIVVIAILATISVVAYNGMQERARQAEINSDIRNLVLAVQAARQATGKTFAQLTGSTASGVNCWNKATGTDLAALPDTDLCITQYKATLTTISTAAGISLGDLRDPWGRPYIIDENEGEGGGCGKDTIAVYKQPFTAGFGVYGSTPLNNVPLSGFTGC